MSVATSAKVPHPRVTTAQAKKIDLTERQLQRLLPLEGTMLDHFAGLLASAEKRWGDDDGSLEPRHVAHASEPVRELMAEVYARTGKKTLPLEEIKKQLGHAAARLIEKAGDGSALKREATEAVIAYVAKGYRKQVLIEGRESASNFGSALGFTQKQWKALQAALPDAFPEPSSVGTPPWRLDGLAAQYAQVVSGEQTRSAFMRRTGLSAEQLEGLTKKDPRRFPYVEAGEAKELSDSEVKALSSRWKELVVSRVAGVEAFLSATTISKSRLNALRDTFPSLFPAPGAATTLGSTELSEAMATAVGKFARKVQEARPLATVSEIVAEWNSDLAKVNRFGELSDTRYYNLRAKLKDAFPAPVRGEEAKELVEATAKELLAANPGLDFEQLSAKVVDALGPLSPFRLEALRKLVPGKPGRKAAEVHETQSSRGGTASLRSTLPVVSLYRLAVRAASPGTTWPEIVERVNAQLEKRGVKGAAAADVNRRLIFDGQPTLEQHQAKVIAAIIAEYARAAPKGASETEVLAAVVADYPRLSSFYVAKFRDDWTKNPKDFPELAPFIEHGKLKLSGRGETSKAPRYVGGWDVDRALSGGSAKETAAVVDLVESARVDVRLPLIDRAKEKLLDGKPLAKTNLLWISHLLGNTFPLGLALSDAGASGPRAHVVGSPYGSNPAVAQALRNEGFNVDVPELSVESYRAAVKKALDATIAEHRKNRDPIVVVDDGGLVAELLHSDPKYKDVLDQVRIVEQTTRGIISAEESDLKTPVIAVARSKSKEYEAQFIGRVVATKMLYAMQRLGQSLDGKHVTVVGYGFVGQALAKAMKDLGAVVTVVERGDEAAAAARKAGYKVSSLEAAAKNTDVLVGATGKTSIDLATLKHLKDGAIVASASSKQVEIDMQGLAGASRRRERVEGQSPALRLPDYHYQLGGKQLTVVGDGWPVNFDGDVAGLPADEIQITLAALFAGALQAAGRQTVWKRGVIPLDAETDAWLLREFKELRAGMKPTPISNPSDWLGLARELGAPGEADAPGKLDLAARFRLKDRGLAEQIAAGWSEHPPYMPVEERLQKILGEKVTFQQFDRLRKALPDVLGKIEVGNELDDATLKRLAKILNAPDRPSLDVVAEQLNADPLFSKVKENWTRGVIKGVVAKYAKYF